MSTTPTEAPFQPLAHDTALRYGCRVVADSSDASTPGGGRLLTEEDFDGLVCAVLLRKLGLTGETQFVHPRDVTDGLVQCDGRDILTGLPFRDDVSLVFNHELVAGLVAAEHDRHIFDPSASSNSAVVFRHFQDQFDHLEALGPMVEAADRAVSRNYTMDEVLHPAGWSMLAFILDPRSGLGRHRGFRISNRRLMLDLIDQLSEVTDIDEILKLPDVHERVELYNSHRQVFEEQVRRCSTIVGNVLFVDWSEEPSVAAGNRFVKYALFPQVNTSLQFSWGFERHTAVFTAGKSIFNRTCSLNIGALMLQYGGGGSADSGSCQVEAVHAADTKHELVTRLLTERVQSEEIRSILKV